MDFNKCETETNNAFKKAQKKYNKYGIIDYRSFALGYAVAKIKQGAK